MPNNQKPYTYYRDFQNVWNTNKVQARVQSKCDGQKPTCRRCRFANAECIYALPKDIARAKQAAKEESDIKKLESSLEEMENELVKVKLILDTVKPKSKPWQITVTIDGFKIQTYITTICQLHGFFTHTANLFTTSRGPAMAFHPVGAQAMIIRLLVRRLCYHDDQKSVQLNVNRLNTPDAHGDFSVPAFMTMKMHQDFLNLVLWQTVECSPALRKNYGEAFLSRISGKRSQSHHYQAFRFALAALNVRHVVVDHLDVNTFPLPVNLNAGNFGCALAEKYFERARELLIDRILECEPGKICADTMDALCCVVSYLVANGRYKGSMVYLGIGLRIATLLDYHKAIRGSSKTVVDVAEFENAFVWNLLTCTDQVLAPVTKLPAHTTAEDTYLNLLGITISAPADMPEDIVQRIQTCLYMSKLSAISHDCLDAWWGNNVSDLTENVVDQFAEAFARWEAELPPYLRVTGIAFKSRASFLLVVGLHLLHQISLLALYVPFLNAADRNPFSIPPDLHQHAERAYSDAAIKALRLVVTYIMAGGCVGPPPALALSINLFPVVIGAHMRLAVCENKEITIKHRAYIRGKVAQGAPGAEGV